MNTPPETIKRKKKKRHSKAERRRRKRQREEAESAQNRSNTIQLRNSDPTVSPETEDTSSKSEHESSLPIPSSAYTTVSNMQIETVNIPPGQVEPSPVLQKMFVRDIQFVYPTTSTTTPSIPYVFSQLRTSSFVANPTSSLTTPTCKNSSAQASNDESIEDILGLKSKKDSVLKIPDGPHTDKPLHHSKHQSLITLVSAKEINQTDQTLYKNLQPVRNEKDTEGYVNEENTRGPLSGRTMDDAVRDTIGRRPRSNSTDGVLNLPRCGLCDETRVLESHQWNHSLTSSNIKVSSPSNGLGTAPCRLANPRGLINLGNTCFLNATLQCLAYLPTFCQCVMSLPNASSIFSNSQHTEGKKLIPCSGKKITMYIQQILGKMHGIQENGVSSTSLSPLAPKALYSAIPLLSGSGRGYTFRPGRQEDAHEFLIHLLDTMQNGELLSAGINPKISGWRDRLPVPRLDETTFIHRVFGGYLRSQVICTLCGYKSNTYDPFLDLALEVNKSSTLMCALTQFMKKETLDAANKWKCSGCNKHVCATKQLTVFRPPLSLIVQLKRFVFGGQGIFSSHRNGGFSKFSRKDTSRSKIQKPIDFSTRLELPLSDGRCCEYYLTGLIVHEGGSATSGHYTACIRKPGSDQNRDEWYHMDDGREVQLILPKPPSRSFENAEEAKKASVARSKARADSLILFDHDHKPNHDNISDITQTIDSSALSGNQQCSKSEGDSLKLMDDFAHKIASLHERPASNLKLTETGGKVSQNELTVAITSTDAPATTLDSSASIHTFNCGSNVSGKDARKSIKINRGTDSVQVFLHNGKKTNLWTPMTTDSNTINRNRISLLGNRNISSWGDDEDHNDHDQIHNRDLHEKRLLALKEMSSHERDRKRKMFLGSWDSALDAGKRKKVSQRHQNSPVKHPLQNPFQSLQQSQMMNPKKGYFRNLQKKK